MLYIFDLDATLVELYGTTPLPNVLGTLHSLTQQHHAIAVATNQAGVAWRKAVRRPPYPKVSEIGPRFHQIVSLLPPLRNAPWFISIYDARVKLTAQDYADLVAEFQEVIHPLNAHISAKSAWRKPNPGMLVEACTYHNITRENATFVGDADTDRDAATNAGMDFVFTERFFEREG
jgi:histidinol phosphatase-like enzyme